MGLCQYYYKFVNCIVDFYESKKYFKDPLESFFGQIRAMCGTYSNPAGVQTLQRIRKFTITQILDDKRVNIFKLKESLKTDQKSFDLDDAISPADEQFKSWPDNHDLTEEASEIGLRLIAG